MDAQDIQANDVHCVFYSHPWAVDALKQQRVGSLEDAAIVEVGQRSQLASLLNRQQRLRYGLSGLLAQPDRIGELVETSPRFPAPVIFSPNPPVGEQVMVSAIALLPTLQSRYRRFVLMVHVSEYAAFRYAYSYCSRFYFLWDLADPPVYPLADLAGSLASMRLLDRSSWGGFFCYAHPQRRVLNGPVRLAQIRGIVKEMPLALANG